MSLLDYFKTSKASSASLAKERLQILVAHERSSRNEPSYLPQLQKELLEVIRKYVNVEQDAISVTFEQSDTQETLELNIVLPENQTNTSQHNNPSER
ncbi:MAG: cell division topological specificity factor MinE [Methylobacter sp.]|nr:MAG: cell division topological specificity factor MinE [Methylobacter sp.]